MVEDELEEIVQTATRDMQQSEEEYLVDDELKEMRRQAMEDLRRHSEEFRKEVATWPPSQSPAAGTPGARGANTHWTGEMFKGTARTPLYLEIPPALPGAAVKEAGGTNIDFEI